MTRGVPDGPAGAPPSCGAIPVDIHDRRTVSRLDKVGRPAFVDGTLFT